MILTLIIALLIGSLVLGAVAFHHLRRDQQPVEDLRAAIFELEVAIGEELVPILRRLADQLDRWSKRP